MSTIAIKLDTALFVSRLRARGFKQEQAEEVSALLRETADATEKAIDGVATKQDLAEMETRLEKRFGQLETGIAFSKYDLAKWMFAGFLTLAGLLVAVLLKIP